MAEVFRRTYRDRNGKDRQCKTYTIRYYDGHGRRYEEPAKTTRKEDAEALAREREQAVWEGRFFPDRIKPRDLTLEGLRDRWLKERAPKKSLRHDRARLDALCARFGKHRLVSTITGEALAEYRDELRKSLAESTVNRHLAVIGSALRLAERQGFPHRNPLAGIVKEKERNARNRVCSRAEYVKLRDAADPELRLAIIIAYHLPMRLGEIVGDGGRRIDLKTRTLRLAAADTKEGAIRTLPLPGGLVGELEAAPRPIDGAWFHATSDAYSKRFGDLAKALGIKDLHFHDFRHTACTAMRRAGIDIPTIQAFSGHKTLAMLRRYMHVSEDDLRVAADKIEAHAAGLDRS